MAFHRTLGDDQIHRIFDKEYVNNTVRDADTGYNGLTENIGKTVFITTTNTVFMLLNTTPTWFEFGGSVTNPDTIYVANADVLANRVVTVPSGRSLEFISFDTTLADFTLAADIDINNGEVDIEAKTGNGSGGITGVSRLLINTTTMQIQDQINSKGFVYAADYSAQFTNRSIVDKEYVDTQVGATDTLAEILVNGNLTGGRNIVVTNGDSVNGTSFALTAGVHTTTPVFLVVADDLTVGQAMSVKSNSIDTGTRNIVEIVNDNVAATGATVLTLQQDANNRGLNVFGAGTSSENVVDITGDALTTGKLLNVISDSNSTQTRNVVEITNENNIASGATALKIQQNANQLAMSIVGEGNTTNNIVDIGGDILTNGKALFIHSDSPSTFSRNLVEISNTNVSSVGARVLRLDQDSEADALLINHNANGAGLRIVALGTTADSMNVTGDLLTTGSLAVFTSNSSDIGTRKLVEIINEDDLAVGAVALNIRQDSTGDALRIQASGLAINATGNVEISPTATTTDAIDVDLGALTSGIGLELHSADMLTTGSIARFKSASADTSIRNLVEIINDDAASTDTTALRIQQDSVGTALRIDGLGTTVGAVFNLQAPALTVGTAAAFDSGSVDTSPRSVVDILNSSSLAVGAVALTITQASIADGLLITAVDKALNLTGNALIATTATTADGAEINGNNLTTGRLLQLYSNSADTDVRTLTRIHNDNPSAIGATALLVQQDANQEAVRINGTGVATGTAVSIAGLEALTGSSARGLNVFSNSTAGFGYVLANFELGPSNIGTAVRIVNDNGGGGGLALTVGGTGARTSLQSSFEVTRTKVAATTYSIDLDDHLIFVDHTATAAVAISIDTFQMKQGRILTIKDSGGNANTFPITITPQAETIDGATSLVLNVNFQSVTLASDGINWFII